MKKQIFKLATLFFVLFTSCHDDKQYPDLSIMEDYLTLAGFTDVSEQIDKENREFGIRFVPIVDGKISGAKIVLPDDAEEIRMTLWDAEKKEILETGALSAGDRLIGAGAGVGVMMHNQVVAGKEYMLTINSNDWYEYKGTTDAIYPIEVKNVLITGFGYAVGTDLVFPTEFPTSYFAGNVDIFFMAN